jgi:hypothetical protein
MSDPGDDNVVARPVAMTPGDVLGYVDWDDPAFGYWAEPDQTPENRTRQTFAPLYPALYGRTQFHAGDIPLLFKAFASEQDAVFRSYVATCVSRLERTQEVFSELVSRTAAGGGAERALAVRALGLFSTSAAEHHLLNALSSDDAQIVRAAAGALIHHPGDDVEAALIPQLSSDEEETVQQVLATLQRIGGLATERELLRLANNRAYFEKYEYYLLAALSGTAGELTRQRLPQLRASGIVDDWTFGLYFRKLFPEGVSSEMRQPGFLRSHRVLVAIIILLFVWAIGWLFTRSSP